MGHDRTRNAPASSRDRLLSYGCFVLIAAVYAGRLFWGLGDGHLTHRDAASTAERSREVLATGSAATIHQNFKPMLRKPPLQYWQTAANLAVFEDKEFAVRLWPALYGLGCFALLGWFVRLHLPDFAWALPASAALLALSSTFYIFSSQALLDSGAAFFLLLTAIGCEKARRDPRWWWLAALGVVLGGLHKAPLGLGYVIVVAVVRSIDPARRKAFWSRRLLLPACAILAGLLLWPLIQLIGHPHAAVETAGQQFDEHLLSVTQWLTAAPATIFYYGKSIVSYWGLIGVASLLALGVCFVLPGLRRKKGLFEATLFTALYLMILLMLANQSKRYLLPVIPLLALLLTCALRHVTAARARLFLPLTALLIAGAWRQFAQINDFTHAQRPDQVAVARELGATLRADERPFFIVPEPYPEFRTPLILFYGDLPRAIYPAKWDRPDSWPLPGLLEGYAVRGITRAQDTPMLDAHFANVRVEQKRGPYVLFTADRYLGGSSPSP